MERAGNVTAFPRAALALMPLLVTGCGGFQSPLSPAGEQAASIHSLFWLMMAVCGFMYILVLAALGFSVARAWRRRGASPGEPSITPSDQDLNRGLLAWAALIVVGLTVLIIAIAVSICSSAASSRHGHWSGAPCRSRSA